MIVISEIMNYFIDNYNRNYVFIIFTTFYFITIMFRNNIQFLQVVRNLKKYWHILYIV